MKRSMNKTMNSGWLAVLMLVLLTAFSVASCQDDEDGGGAPVIHYVRVTDPALADSTFTDAQAMRQWVNALKDGQMAVVKCAHWPLTECPRAVADVIEGWVFKRFAPQSAAQASSN